MPDLDHEGHRLLLISILCPLHNSGGANVPGKQQLMRRSSIGHWWVGNGSAILQQQPQGAWLPGEAVESNAAVKTKVMYSRTTRMYSLLGTPEYLLP